MKISVKLLLVAASLALVTASPAPAVGVNHEVSLGGLVFMPQDGLFSTGAGGQLTYRYWLSPDWALFADFGVTHVNVKRDRVQVAPGTSGSFDLLPLGGGMSCNVIDIAPVCVNLNLGLGYGFVSSGATCLDDVTKTKVLDMTLDNIFYGKVGLDADWVLSQHWSIFAAAGFRQDFSKNKLQTVDGPLRATEFSGFDVQLGVRYSF